ncbi:MAG: hypothetical protein V4615_04900 [Bacteroidota bacterium]
MILTILIYGGGGVIQQQQPPDEPPYEPPTEQPPFASGVNILDENGDPIQNEDGTTNLITE